EADGARVLAMVEADPAVGLDEAPAWLALGIASMARARYPDAVTHLRYLDELKRGAGICEPRLCAHAAELVEALGGTGEVAGAAEVLDRFEREAERSRGSGRRPRRPGAGPWSSARRAISTEHSTPPGARSHSSTACPCRSSAPVPCWRSASCTGDAGRSGWAGGRWTKRLPPSRDAQRGRAPRQPG